MSDTENQEWWMWQMYRATAEFMQNPNSDREERLKYVMDAYRERCQQHAVQPRLRST